MLQSQWIRIADQINNKNTQRTREREGERERNPNKPKIVRLHKLIVTLVNIWKHFTICHWYWAFGLSWHFPLAFALVSMIRHDYHIEMFLAICILGSRERTKMTNGTSIHTHTQCENISFLPIELQILFVQWKNLPTNEWGRCNKVREW